MESKDENRIEKYPYEKNMRKLLSQFIWTHKIQVCELDIEIAKQKHFKIIRGILYSLSSCGVITGVCIDNQLTTLISAIIALLIGVCDTLLQVGDYSKRIGSLEFVSQQLFHNKNMLAFEISKCEQGKYTNSQIEEIFKQYTDLYEASCKNKIPESKRAIELASQKLLLRKDEEINDDLVDEELNQ